MGHSSAPCAVYPVLGNQVEAALPVLVPPLSVRGDLPARAEQLRIHTTHISDRTAFYADQRLQLLELSHQEYRLQRGSDVLSRYDCWIHFHDGPKAKFL